MVEFYEYDGKVYRLLLSLENGMWLINFEEPGKPILVSGKAVSKLSRAEIPAEQFDESDISKKRSAVMEKRLAIIEPLLNKSELIIDATARKRAIDELAAQTGLSARTLYRFYFAYLARGEKGLLPESRVSKRTTLSEKDIRNIQQTINEVYYSPKRPSVYAAYEMMLMRYYRTEEGTLLDSRPSFSQFNYILRKNRDIPREIIAREGLGEFKKNYRPLFGNGDSGVENIGVYEIDATVADIYVVSRYDRKPIGRPVLYVAVDIASRLIVGIHVGLEENAEAVMCCIRNAAMDKVEYCKKYGIDIDAAQWPSCGMPGAICTDRGRDFLSSRCKELCMMFGVEVTSLPAYRPDLKGYVERAIGFIQNRYKPQLRGYGVVDKVKAERAAPNFALQAILDIDEFTTVVIACVLFYNSSYVLKDYIRSPEMIAADVRPFAADIWRWKKEIGNDLTKKVDAESLELMLLPRSTGRITRSGVEFNRLYYYTEEMANEFVRAGVNGSREAVVAYDPNNSERLYLVENGIYYPLKLTQASRMYGNMSHQEVRVLNDNEKKCRKGCSEQQITGAVACVADIENTTIAALRKSISLTVEDTLTETMNERKEKELRDDK